MASSSWTVRLTNPDPGVYVAADNSFTITDCRDSDGGYDPEPWHLSVNGRRYRTLRDARNAAEALRDGGHQHA